MGSEAIVKLTALFVVVAALLFYGLKRSGPAHKELWCPVCKKPVRATLFRKDRMLQLALTIFTFGLWIIVWACTVDLRRKGPYRCPVCGGEIDERAVQVEKPSNL